MTFIDNFLAKKVTKTPPKPMTSAEKVEHEIITFWTAMLESAWIDQIKKRGSWEQGENCVYDNDYGTYLTKTEIGKYIHTHWDRLSKQKDHRTGILDFPVEEGRPYIRKIIIDLSNKWSDGVDAENKK